MSHVEFKKRTCHPVGFRGQWPSGEGYLAKGWRGCMCGRHCGLDLGCGLLGTDLLLTVLEASAY